MNLSKKKYFIFISLIIYNTLIFSIFQSQPWLFLILILFLTILINFLIYTHLCNSWVILIIIFAIIRGVLVLFSYISSLSTDGPIVKKNPLIAWLPLIFFFNIFYFLFLYWKLLNNAHLHSQLPLHFFSPSFISSFLITPFNLFTFIFGLLYILIALFILIEIINHNKNNLRIKISL